MAITIRLAKTGKKNSPSYRIVVLPVRSKRDGKNLGIIGHFNPSANPVLFEYNKGLLNSWVGKGAILTDAVKKLLDGKYEFKKYSPKKDKAKNQ